MPGAPRRAPPLDLVLDKRSTIPLYLQLKHHLIHLISSGAWHPGMPIPSVRQLAADLGLATATVQRAYGELQDLGILVGQAGRGVYVADLANGVPDVPGERRGILRGLLARSVSHALSLGFTQREIVGTVQQQLAGRAGAGGPGCVVFVGSTSDVAAKYERLLAEALADLAVRVTGVPVATLREDADGLLDRLEPVRCLVALVRTFPEIRQLAGHRGAPLFGLVVGLTHDTQQRIRDTPANEPIGVVASEAYLTSARTIVRRFRGGDDGSGGGDGIRGDDDVIWADSRNRRAVRRVVETCPTIVHTFGEKELVGRLAGHRRLIELEYLPTPTSIDRLRAIVAPATALTPGLPL